MHKNKKIIRRGPSRGKYLSTYSECTKYLRNKKQSCDIYNLNFFLKLDQLKIKLIREDEYDVKTDKFNNKTVLEKEYCDVLFRINLSRENHYRFYNDGDVFFFLHRVIFRFKGCQKFNSGYKNISFLDGSRDYWKTPIISNYKGSSVGEDCDSVWKDYDYEHYYNMVETALMFNFDFIFDDDSPKFKLELKEKVIAPGFIHYHYSINGYPFNKDINLTTRSIEKRDNKELIIRIN